VPKQQPQCSACQSLPSSVRYRSAGATSQKGAGLRDSPQTKPFFRRSRGLLSPAFSSGRHVSSASDSPRKSTYYPGYFTKARACASPASPCIASLRGRDFSKDAGAVARRHSASEAAIGASLKAGRVSGVKRWNISDCFVVVEF
jgi:hypothetical protein